MQIGSINQEAHSHGGTKVEMPHVQSSNAEC